MARVLVTGGAGFLGSHLCERLIERLAVGERERAIGPLGDADIGEGLHLG